MNGWIAFGASIVGALIGGGITGWFTLKAVEKTYFYDRELDTQRERSLMRSLLRAIYDEIESIWEIYQDKMGVKVENLTEEEGIHFYYPVMNDYFTVYHANASLIGRIQNDDLRKEIITFYTSAKGIVDSYRLNNEMLQKHDYWILLFAETGKEQHKKNIEVYSVMLAGYAKLLKEHHLELKEQKIRLLRVLRQYIDILEHS